VTTLSIWIAIVGLSSTIASVQDVRGVRLQPDRERGVRLEPNRGEAQAPIADGKREFTISGCLIRSGYAGYQIDDARIDAIDGKPVADDAASKSPTTPQPPKKWILEGGGNLGADTGKKLQVTGRSDWNPSSSAADEPPNQTPHLDVKSIKTIASTCS
jgi:hypothetical protein